MNRLRSMSVTIGVLLAVLLPLGQAHCALMSPRTAPAATHVEQPGNGDHDCCDEPSSAPAPAGPSDPCCCDGLLLPAATAPAAFTLSQPTADSILLAAVYPAVSFNPPSEDFVTPAPTPPTASPPDPASSPRSPRSPPDSA